ncbi:hypothetical protein A2U01_0117408, partial [Trifolium medium]|nr:hypothetical protein [Trifolium medium]
AMEAFKVEVKEELAAQRAKMEDMSAKQEVMEQKIDGISSDLKTLISLFQNRNP